MLTSRLTSLALIGLLFSCSILEDSDVTSYDELKTLKLKGIEFRQVLSSRTYQRGIPATDSVLNISFSQGTLKRQTKLNWGTMESDSKFRFRSGATSNIIIRNRYFDNGRLYSSVVFSDNIVRETYFFRYNSKGKLLALSRNIYTDPKDLTKRTNTYDSLSYDPNGLYSGFALRSSNDATRRGVFVTEPISTNPCEVVWVFKRSVNTNNPADDKEYDYCSPTNFYIYPGGQNSDFRSTGSDLLEEVYIGDRFKDVDKKCCADRYYYHPVLFLPVELRYKIMYAVDWWEEGATTSSTNKEESVQFTFFYEL